jgi:hypothetical protein
MSETLRICGCCRRELDEGLGETHVDDFGVPVWVCDECWHEPGVSPTDGLNPGEWEERSL